MANYTPMMQQYFEIKDKYTDCILFYRLGDFYEMFFEDAILASDVLELHLTGRDCGQKERAPMCGVPYHAADAYIARLIQKGYRVAICEQVSDPKLSKTLVKREVVRVVSPGTVTDNNYLDEGRNNYIFCIFETKEGYGIAACDVSTGEFITTSFVGNQSNKIVDEIAKLNPAEIITSEGFTHKNLIENVFRLPANSFDQWSFEYANALQRLCSHFKVLNLNGFGIEEDDLAIGACGALLEYLYQTQMNSLSHISTIKNYGPSEYMLLDISSRRNLELCETIKDRTKKGSLLWILDKTKTSMGARLLRKWIEQPLLDVKQINKRLSGVEEFKNDVLIREEFKEYLHTIYDIERLLGKIVYQSANARDINALKSSLEHLPTIKMLLLQLKSPCNTELFNDLDCLEDIYKLIQKHIVEDPPFSIREGGFINMGVNKELDKYKTAKTKGSTWLSQFEQAQKDATGIKNLRVKYNKIFGYYIEVTNSYASLVPEQYIRRQTLANAERYTTLELKEIEDAILGADEKIVELEYTIFVELRQAIALEMARIQKCAEIIGSVDVLVSLGDVADANNYVKPVVNDAGILDIKNGRHPVIEKVQRGNFIPNDTYLDLDDYRLSVITGPNMAGKSTYMRQTALIVLMAQIGSYIPADSATIGVCDRIFTRVGASDDLATGQSTFMVEMSEVANILNNASKNSLLILDEIGRGTSTFDGLSIAWSVLEHIANRNQLGAKTLFATHYHELTELEGRIEGIVNYRVSVSEQGNDIVFLRKIVRGGTDRSYGIHVARLAGIPNSVIERANEVMITLLHSNIINKEAMSENIAISDEVIYYSKKKPSSANSDKKNMIIEEIKKIDIETMTPRDAMKTLMDIIVKTEAITEDS